MDQHMYCMSSRVTLAQHQPALPPQANLTLQEAVIMVIIIMLSIYNVFKCLGVLQECSELCFSIQELTIFLWSVMGIQA